MKNIRRGLAVCFALAGSVLAADAPKPATPPPSVPLIFDTDIGNDCDDAMALAVIHALQNRQACQLLAVTLTNPDPLAGRLVDAINTFYGRGDISIGVNPQAPEVSKVSRYLKTALDYPHDFDPARAPTALALLRRTLAAAEDRSVVVVQVGFFTNLAQLLASPADDISPLAGRELVKRKVRLLSVMAGAFQPVRGTNYFLEFNVKFDIPAAIRVASDWPTPAVWSGAEIGEAVLFPAAVVDRDFAYVPRHPVYDSYQSYRHTPHERPCYDLTSVLQAVWPDRDYFAVSVPGKIQVLPDSFTKFVPAKDGRDRFLIVDRERSARVRELFAALVSEPPAAPAGK
jgi:inosine-uridine nucleoside N-ribohydrolase